MKNTYFKLKVHTSSKKDRLIQKGADRFEVWVREPAENNRANRAVLALLANHLKMPAGRLWIIKGAHEPSKIIAVR